MTTILEAMQAHAYSEFDRLIEERAQAFRKALRADGRSMPEIDQMLATIAPGIAEQRATIGSMVTVAFLRAGAPVDGDADDLA